MIPTAILDLAPIVQGSDASRAFANSRDLARHAERLGYSRYWLAEHHNMPGIASAATAVVIVHVAGGTKTTRVAPGGIMLPNQPQLMDAQPLRTTESLHPGRNDLRPATAPSPSTPTPRSLPPPRAPPTTTPPPAAP